MSTLYFSFLVRSVQHQPLAHLKKKSVGNILLTYVGELQKFAQCCEATGSARLIKQAVHEKNQNR